MRTRQSVAVNPLVQSNFPPRTQPLFRPEFQTTDVRCLPFVHDLHRREARQHGGRRTFWSYPPPTDYADAIRQGKLFAAAYLIFLRKNGAASLPLTWIVRDMGTEMDAVSIGFFEHLQRHAWSHAANMTSGEVEAYARNFIENDLKLVSRELALAQ